MTVAEHTHDGGADGAPLALLFPGQGSQTPTMREDVERWCPGLAELTAEAVGSDPFARVDEGTHFLQPALFCATLAGWRRLAELGGTRGNVIAVAGHSLGELAALVAAGSLGAEEGLELVALRGRLMDSAARADDSDGGMLAILGGESDAVAAMSDRHGVTVANDNAPGQVVVSGPGVALDAMTAEARGAGLKAMRLPIRGAFHSPAMAGIVDEFEAAVRAAAPRPPTVPVFCGVTAAPFDDIARRLAEGLVRGVRWRETLYALDRLGARRFVEVGPGTVLTKIVRRTLPHAEATAVAEMEAAYA